MLNMIDIKEVLLLWFINSLIKKTCDSGVSTLANKSAFNNEIKQNEQLAEELHNYYKTWKKKSLLFI